MRNRQSSFSPSFFRSANERANKRATRVEHFTTDWPLVRNKSGGEKGERRGDTCNLPPLSARTSPSIFIHVPRGIITPRLARARAFILPSFVNLGKLGVCRDILHFYILSGENRRGLNCIFYLALILTRFHSCCCVATMMQSEKREASSALKLNEYEVSRELCGRIVKVSRAKIG